MCALSPVLTNQYRTARSEIRRLWNGWSWGRNGKKKKKTQKPNAKSKDEPRRSWQEERFTNPLSQFWCALECNVLPCTSELAPSLLHICRVDRATSVNKSHNNTMLSSQHRQGHAQTRRLLPADERVATDAICIRNDVQPCDENLPQTTTESHQMCHLPAPHTLSYHLSASSTALLTRFSKVPRYTFTTSFIRYALPPRPWKDFDMI